MSWYVVLKLLHVLSVMWLLSGVLARPTVLAAARRAPDIRLLKAIADVSGRLEERMIAPGILAVIATGVATALAGGYSLLGPLTGGPWWIFIPVLILTLVVVTTPMALARDRRWGEALEEAARVGTMTDTLRHYLDRSTMIRRYAPDVIGVFVIVVLMVTKPF